MAAAVLPAQLPKLDHFVKQAGPRAVDASSQSYQQVQASLAQIASQSHGDFRDELFKEGRSWPSFLLVLVRFASLG